MKRKSLIVFILFLCVPIYSLELILKNGDIFIADFVSENETVLTIKWKNEVYILPKSEIRSVDLAKSGANKSYRPIEYILKDGSRVRAIFVEQEKDTLTLKSELGFLKIEKSKISKIEGDVSEDFPPPREFTDKNYKKFFTNIGFYVSGNVLAGNPLAEKHPYAYGGGFYIEPAFLQWTNKFRAGILSDYQQAVNQNNPNFLDSYNNLIYLQSLSSGTNLSYVNFINTDQTSKSRLDFINIIPYLQYRINPSRFLDFYVNVGIGTSYLKLIDRQTSITGFIPAGYFAFGWQGLSFNKVVLRIGCKATYIRESNSGVLLEGADISVGYML